MHAVARMKARFAVAVSALALLALGWAWTPGDAGGQEPGIDYMVSVTACHEAEVVKILEDMDFEILERTSLANLDIRLLRVRPPEGFDLEEVRRAIGSKKAVIDVGSIEIQM